MKEVVVVAACIVERGRVLAAQRGYGDDIGFDETGWWEFPGGKVEAGEDPRAALRREIAEELSAEVRVGEEVAHVEFDYPAMRLNLTCYHCHLDSDVSVREHQSIRWLGPDELETVPWLPADLEILAEVRTLLVQPYAPEPTPGLFAAGNGSDARG